MKNVMVITLCLVACCTNNLYAQKSNGSTVIHKMQPLQMRAARSNEIHIKAMRDFVKRNNGVENVEWMVADNGYVVKYNDGNNSRCRTAYNSRGNHVYTIRQYNEHQLLREIRGIVKSTYYDYAITLVEQIEVPSKPVVYLVHLQDATTLKKVRICEGEMEVIEEYVQYWQ